MKTKTQHTPGPWEADDFYVTTQAGSPPRTIACSPSPYTWRKADARLIAAAPELLNACRELLEVLEKSNAHGEEYQWDPLDEAARLRAAIAKATGQEDR
jgi:hypothetical protein